MMFKENENKTFDIQLQVKMIRDKDDLLSPWQISNFVSTISSHYYKNEILNTISLALKEGISPENIFIFDSSFSLYNTYSDLDVIDLEDVNGVKDYYHLGNTISLFPNELLIKFNIVFGYFRKVNEILGRYNLNRINKDILIHLYNDVRNNKSITEKLSEINNFALEIAGSSKEKDFNINQLQNSMNNSLQRHLRNYEEFQKDQVNIELVIEEIKENILDSFEHNEKYNHLEKKYFSAFFNKLHDLKRPVVAIYYDEERKIQILCDSFINTSKRDSKFLDIKQISHNSPYLICFYIGVSIVLPLIPLLKSIKLKNEIEDGLEALRVEEHKTNLEIEHMIKELEELSELPENKAIEEVELQYLNNQIKEHQEINNMKFRKPIETYDFDNRSIEISRMEIKKSS